MLCDHDRINEACVQCVHQRRRSKQIERADGIIRQAWEDHDASQGELHITSRRSCACTTMTRRRDWIGRRIEQPSDGFQVRMSIIAWVWDGGRKIKPERAEVGASLSLHQAIFLGCGNSHVDDVSTPLKIQCQTSCQRVVEGRTDQDDYLFLATVRQSLHPSLSCVCSTSAVCQVSRRTHKGDHDGNGSLVSGCE